MTAGGGRPTPPGDEESGPTELVPTEGGDYVERLSGGTATLLLVWLIGVGAGSALLALWLLAAAYFGQRLGIRDLFSGLGFYVAIFGASGPTVLWLVGRAQEHRLGWWIVAALKIDAVMMGTVLAVSVVAALIMGVPLTGQVLLGAGLVLAATVPLALVWALATWAADRYIAAARQAHPAKPEV